jgi:multiple sugar transport system substrate-binding protein
MICEWSAFYKTLTEPTSKVKDSLGIAPEPKGPDGRKPALGGFSLAVTSQVDDKKKGAAWLFIQWITSKAKAKEYVEKGGVSGRQSTYKDEALVKQFPFIPPATSGSRRSTALPWSFRWPRPSPSSGSWDVLCLTGTLVF